jgi:hypothetical protein
MQKAATLQATRLRRRLAALRPPGPLTGEQFRTERDCLDAGGKWQSVRRTAARSAGNSATLSAWPGDRFARSAEGPMPKRRWLRRVPAVPLLVSGLPHFPEAGHTTWHPSRRSSP